MAYTPEKNDRAQQAAPQSAELVLKQAIEQAEMSNGKAVAEARDFVQAQPEVMQEAYDGLMDQYKAEGNTKMMSVLESIGVEIGLEDFRVAPAQGPRQSWKKRIKG